MRSPVPALVDSIREVIGNGPAPLHEPVLGRTERRYLRDCVSTGFVSSVGPYVRAFEEKLAEVTGAQHAVAVSSGTAALQIALRVAGVRPGDEVLVPSLTFVATANAVTYLGATPHFVDVEETTLGVDPAALRIWLEATTDSTEKGLRNKTTGNTIRALVAVHTFGHPSRVDALSQLADDFGLVLVEDAAESLGSTYKGAQTGTFGALSAVSFNGNKIVTTGGGGAVLTNDSELAQFARHLSTTAKITHPWEYLHDDIGYNFRMPNLNAALGVAQLEQLDSFVRSKRALTCRYQQVIGGLEGFSLFVEPPESRSNYWLQTLRLEDEVMSFRHTILEDLNSLGIGVRPVWRPLHLLDIYNKSWSAPLPVTERLGSTLINIPSSAGLV